MGAILILSAVQPKVIWGSATSNFPLLTFPNMDSEETLGQDDVLKPEQEENLDEK